jgi:signal transduction histidine kinase
VLLSTFSPYSLSTLLPLLIACSVFGLLSLCIAWSLILDCHCQRLNMFWMNEQMKSIQSKALTIISNHQKDQVGGELSMRTNNSANQKTQDTSAQEMRHMIANVAHDLKTVSHNLFCLYVFVNF